MKVTSTPNRFYRSFLFGVILLAGCAVPRHFLPQKDIIGSDIYRIPGQDTVLIASRGTEYKKQLVAKLQQQLSDAKISHITIGIKQLDKVESTDYAVVVVISTCLAWGLDHEVRTFLDKQITTSNIILLTTSGKGSWLPDKRKYECDAISGASVKANIVETARTLTEKIEERLSHFPHSMKR